MPAAPAGRPVGTVTRGTTNPNRLRRADRWLTGPGAPVLRRVGAPVIVDLGFGASPVTTLELAARVAAVNPRARVIGIEIDPERVAAAQALGGAGVSFRRGGFEVPLADVPGAEAGAHVIRAFNVLRQYEEAQVGEVWARLRGRLAPGGVLVDGTCDELGRLASWVALSPDGPLSWTMSVRLATLERPSQVAERLPKALIHRNVPGTWIHQALAELDRHWLAAAPQASFGVRQRWLAACRAYAAARPVIGGPARWRLGELTLPWCA